MKNTFKFLMAASCAMISLNSSAGTIIIHGTGGATVSGDKVTLCPTADNVKACATIMTNAQVINGTITDAPGVAYGVDDQQQSFQYSIYINSITNITQQQQEYYADGADCDVNYVQ